MQLVQSPRTAGATYADQLWIGLMHIPCLLHFTCIKVLSLESSYIVQVWLSTLQP